MTFLSKKPVTVAALVLRVVLGVIFVYAAWVKLREPWALFAMSIDSYQVLPLWAVEQVARVLPWFELLLARHSVDYRLVAKCFDSRSLAPAGGLFQPDGQGDGQGHANRLRLLRTRRAPVLDHSRP